MPDFGRAAGSATAGAGILIGGYLAYQLLTGVGNAAIDGSKHAMHAVQGSHPANDTTEHVEEKGLAQRIDEWFQGDHTFKGRHVVTYADDDYCVETTITENDEVHLGIYTHGPDQDEACGFNDENEAILNHKERGIARFADTNYNGVVDEYERQNGGPATWITELPKEALDVNTREDSLEMNDTVVQDVYQHLFDEAVEKAFGDRGPQFLKDYTAAMRKIEQP